METLAWGFGDSMGDLTYGYVRINGVEWLTTPTSTTTKLPGFHILELETDECATVSYHYFNTDSSNTNAAALVTYINGLQPSTVLIGVTADDAAAALTQQAKNALLSIGVNLNALDFRWKATFVTQVGRPSMNVTKLKIRGGASLELTAVVTSKYNNINDVKNVKGL